MNLLARERVRAEAARLFGERGFHKVTVREICAAAKANVAAVNYHFGDKMGLYAEVVDEGLLRFEQETKALADAEAPDPEARLRVCIRAMVEQLLSPAPGAHAHQLLIHEMNDPTPLRDRIAKGVMRPRLSQLCRIVGELMGRPPADRAVINAASSVHAQCLLARMAPIGKVPEAAELADHITRFSLAGIRELSQRDHDQ